MEKRKKRFQGVVISDRNQKSVVVKVSTKKKHPTYGKQVAWSKNYMVHDPENQGQVGDTVEIVESRPHSKRKAFELHRVIGKAEKV